MRYILSFSGGKDSTYLLLELIRRKLPLDVVVFFDTGWEFPEMYEHIKKCERLCREHNIEFITIQPVPSFDYLFYHQIVHKRNGDLQQGNSWCGGKCRWGTGIKLKTLDSYCKNDDIVYIAIASDETKRLKKERRANKRFPLAEWGVTEAECLQGCYNYGFTWSGLYEHLDRVSCMYCTNKNLKELRNIRQYHPDVWDKLKQMQDKTDRPYKKGVTVHQLETRFELEDEYTKQGLSIRSRAFFKVLRERLEECKVVT